jgi:hypothetical protein
VYILWDINRTNVLNYRNLDNCGTRGTIPGPDVLGSLSERGVVQRTERGFSSVDKAAIRLNTALAHAQFGNGVDATNPPLLLTRKISRTNKTKKCKLLMARSINYVRRVVMVIVRV